MTVTYETHYHGYPILTNQQKQQGCNTQILDKVESLLDHTTKKHNKVFVFRMDLNYPKDYKAPEDNKHIQTFMSKFIKYGKRQGYDPDYLWVREQSREKHQHYHLAVFCDGNKIQHPQKLLNKAEDHWGQTIGQDPKGLVDHCTRSRQGQSQPNSYMMRRNDDDFEEKKQACFQRCSYLAKTNTKGYAPHKIREIATSRLPK